MLTLNAVTLRRQLLALDPSLTVTLKNVRINGALQGCSGFVVSGRGVVYVSTDRNHGTNSRALYRTALDTRDYRGGTNHFADFADTARAVVDHLKGLPA